MSIATLPVEGEVGVTIFQEIKTDHREITGLARRLVKTSERSKRADLWRELKNALIVHEKAEELTVYAALKNKVKTETIAYAGLEEHALLDHLIEKLDALDKHREKWAAKMHVLAEMIDLHVREEESVRFKKMRAVFEGRELEHMAVAMRALKKKLKPPAGFTANPRAA